jgi:hypothetical protein
VSWRVLLQTLEHLHMFQSNADVLNIHIVLKHVHTAKCCASLNLQPCQGQPDCSQLTQVERHWKELHTNQETAEPLSAASEAMMSRTLVVVDPPAAAAL